MTPARIAVVACGLLQLTRLAQAAPPPLRLEVDARDVLRGIQHVRLTIPVAPGPLTLVYPQWIPGEHVPSGPLTQVVSLRFAAAGQPLAWRRDDRDAFAFALTVPRGVSTLEVEFDFVSPPKAFGDGYGKTPSVTPHLLVLPFNQVLLHPRGASDAQTVQASVRIPDGWGFDCALRPTRTPAGALELPEVSLTTLVDSPLLAGEHWKTLPITAGAGATRMSIAADAPGDLAVETGYVASLQQLVAEAQVLFGGRHYREYTWLIALANSFDTNGLEHHESTDIREAESFFTDAAQRMRWGSVVVHEYVHSWNGKHRRPAGMATPDDQQPMRDELLWVYEGMTRYLGDAVLRARSGLRTPEEARSYIAWVAAVADRARPGRAWRPLADTAIGLPGYNQAPGEWTPIRRSRDYYDEMVLVWLEADVVIRQQTGGARSFDDFCRAFFGPVAGASAAARPGVRPYTRTDLVQALGSVAAYDWDGFLTARVDAINPRAPLGGIQGAGWRLVYDDTPNVYQVARAQVTDTIDLGFSLGLWARPDGSVTDVVHGGPAFAASIAPGMKISAIGGHKWSRDAAQKALLAAKGSAAPIELVVESADLVRTLALDYHAGLRFPHLERDPSAPDLLSAILAPRVAAATAAAP